MNIDIRIIDGPLPATRLDWRPAGAGAVVWFEGIVRPEEEGRPIAALDYEVYEPMASRQLGRLSESLAGQHALVAIGVEHSRGRVGVGECSFRLRIAAIHRKEAIAAMDQFIDQLKKDVPIWKKPIFADR